MLQLREIRTDDIWELQTLAKVLVTGGAGFIGSHVVRAYLSSGHDVTIVDDLSSGKKTNVPEGIDLHVMDVRNPAISDLMRRLRPDVVNHHAAQISVTRSVRDPQFDAHVNVVGSVNVLEACAQNRIAQFIFASTGGALYGEPKYLPCDETHPIAPLSPYGVAKRCVEEYVSYYGLTHGLSTVVLRYGNVFGPRQDPHGEAGVVAIFAQRMLSDRQVEIFGHGLQERDFVYAGDVAQANLLALTKGNGDVFNIGNGKGTSVNELHQLVAEATRCDIPAVYKPPRSGEVFKITLDCSKAAQKLGWHPKLDLKTAIERTVASFEPAQN